MSNTLNKVLKSEIDKLSLELKRLNYNLLPISEYNMNYIQNIKPFL